MEVNLVAGNGAPAANGEPSSESTGEGAAPAFVTEEALKGVLEKFNNDLRTHYGREMKSLKEALAASGDSKPSDSGGKPDPSPSDQTLKQKMAAMEEREAKQRLKALRFSLRDALVKQGADPRLAELAVPALLEAEQDRFTVGENTFGDFVVTYGEDTVDTWANVFMSGEDGKRMKGSASAPSLDLPRGNGDNAAGRGMKEVPYSQLSSLSTEELDSGRIIAVDG